MKNKICIGIFAIVLLSAFASAQTVTEESYIKAREVLDKSISAYGGLSKLRSIQSFSLKAVGDTVQ